MTYTFLLSIPISSIQKGTKVRLCSGDFTFDKWFLPSPDDVIAITQKWVHVKYDEIEHPVNYHGTYHPMLATIMDSLSERETDNSKMQVETKLDCVMSFSVKSIDKLPVCCRDACGRLLEPISIES